jgi:hypothetical protein
LWANLSCAAAPVNLWGRLYNDQVRSHRHGSRVVVKHASIGVHLRFKFLWSAAI